MVPLAIRNGIRRRSLGGIKHQAADALSRFLIVEEDHTLINDTLPVMLVVSLLVEYTNVNN